MTDQAPPAPAGCVYGPWFDQSSKMWICFNDLSEPAYWRGKWDFDEVLESPLCREIMRLAKENAELRASQPSEEDRAVLWLMKREDYDVCFERDHFAVYRRVEDTDNDWCWVSDSPVEEAKKLGWGG